MSSCGECGTELLMAGDSRVCGHCLLGAALNAATPSPEPTGRDLTVLLAKPVSALGVKFHSFGDYELLAEIARGGMGVVFRARQVSLNRAVALKMILGGDLATAESVNRFRREAAAAAHLDHPNIVPVFEVGEHDGLHYFSMKLVRGGSLADRIHRGPMPQSEVATLMAKIARAIAFAHQRGVLHRDLKPGNILVDEDSEPHITDFGLAKLLSADGGNANTRVVGTPSYLAPEQLDGAVAFTPAADIYSLGVILYEMLSGRLPFQGSTGLETMRRAAAGQVPRLRGTDADLEAICFKCLESNPARRYATAELLAVDLEKWVRGESVSARRPGIPAQASRWIRRRPAAAVLIVLAALLTAAVPLVTQTIHIAREEKRDFISSVREEKIRELQSLRKDWAKLDVPFVSISSELRSEIWKARATPVAPETKRERYSIGIYAHENPVETAGQFAPFLAWLENTVSAARSNRVRFDLRIYKDNRAARLALVYGAVDVVRLGAGPFLVAQDEIRSRNETIEVLAKASPGEYEAVVFTRTNSGIRSIAHLKGRTLALGDPESTISGFHVPALLAECGFTSEDVGVQFHRSHTESVNQVLRGSFDAGVVKAASFGREKYLTAGLLVLTNVTCISMPWVARSGLQPEAVSVLRQSLLALSDKGILDLLPDKPTGFEPANAAEYEAMEGHRVNADRFLQSQEPTLASSATDNASKKEER